MPYSTVGKLIFVEFTFTEDPFDFTNVAIYFGGCTSHVDVVNMLGRPQLSIKFELSIIGRRLRAELAGALSQF